MATSCHAAPASTVSTVSASSSAVRPAAGPASTSPPATRRRAASAAETDFHVETASRVGPGLVYTVGVWQCGAATCDSVFRSRDGGHTWTALRAPLRAGTDRAEIAFATASVGWIADLTGGTLYVTGDAGTHWQELPLGGVTALTTTPRAGYMVARDRLYLASLTNRTLTDLGASAGDGLLVAEGVVYNYANLATVRASDLLEEVRGSRLTTERVPATCRDDWSAALSMTRSGEVTMICGSEPGTGQQLKTAYDSADNGRNWHRIAAPPPAGYISDGAAGSYGAFVTGGQSDLEVTHDDGHTWTVAVSGSNSAGGLGDVGFSRRTYGWAVDDGPPADLYLSDDGGETWRTARTPTPLPR